MNWRPSADSPMMLLVRLARQAEHVVLLVPGMFIGYSLAAAGGVGFAKWLETVTGQLNQSHREDAHWIALSLVGYLCLRGVGTLIGSYSSRRLTAGLAHNMRMKLFHKVLKVPMATIREEGTGKAMMRVTMVCNAASNAALNLILILLRDGMQVIFLVAYMLYLSWSMTLLLFITLPIVVFLFGYASRGMRGVAEENQAAQGGLAQQVTEVIDGLQVVKIFQGEARESSHFRRSSKQMLKRQMRMTILQSTMIPAVQVITGVVAALITYLCLAEITTALNGEQFVAFFATMGLLFGPLRQMTSFNIKLQLCSVAARNMFSFLSLEEEMRDGEKLPAQMLLGIRAKNLSFSYPDGTKALHNVSFQLKPGTTTALVGHSGSGKTTLTSLLCGFYRGWTGELSLDEHDLQKVSVVDVREKIAIVGQDVILFSGTLADNIAYGCPDASRQEIEDAARRADAWEFISNLREGLDTPVGAGGTVLSGGQKQRISIARAFLNDTPVLLLDEATASLDNISERKIQKVLRKLMEGRVTLIISHRLQFVKEADNILVLKKGEVVERGTHEELLGMGGHYTALYQHQPEKKKPAPPAEENMLLSEQVHTLPLPIVSSRHPPTRSRPGFSLERSWYGRSRWLWMLAPASSLLYLLWAFRALLYRIGLGHSWKLSTPLVVIGNLTAGGTGKTPFVAWLAKKLIAQGFRVGIVSRGHGGKSSWYPLVVEKDTSVLQAGDEAWLLRQELHCPVVVGPDRLQAAAELLRRYPCDVLLSDDGLQHLRLGRQAEIVMLDAKRRFGNGMLLPAGPLREPKQRLKKVLCAVVKDGSWAGLPCPSWRMDLKPIELVHLDTKQRTKLDQWLWNKRVHACAAIGNPSSFFDSLRRLGFEVIEHAFPDHHVFKVDDLIFADSLPVMMTQKDACKCGGMSLPNAWFLEVQTELNDGGEIVELVLQHLGLSPAGVQERGAQEVGAQEGGVQEPPLRVVSEH